jgi:tetratricopeptide (TPR) repeat protein
MISRIGSRLLVAAFAASIALGCATDEQKATKHIERAKSHIEGGRAKEALLELRSALKLRPQDSEINYQIARVLEGQNAPAEAAFFYGEANRLDPERIDAALALARLVVGEDPDRAEELVTRALEREPDNAHAYIQKSEIALIRVDTKGALSAALMAVKLSPEDAAPRMQEGRVHEARVREAELNQVPPDPAFFSNAIAAFDKAAELSKGRERLRALFERARTLSAWPGHQDEAKQAYRELVAAAGAEEDLKSRVEAARAAVQHAEDVHDRAFRVWGLEQLVEADPAQLEVWVDLARMKEVDAPGGGDAVLRRMLELRPDDGDAHMRYAVYLARSGKGDQAIAHIEATVAKGVQPAKLMNFLAEMQRQSGDAEASGKTLERLRKEYPDDVETELADARSLIQKGDFARVAERMEALASKSNHPEALRLLALAEAQRGRVPQAQAAIDRILEIDPNPEASVQRLRAQIAFGSGRWKDVIDAMREVERKSPPLLPRDQLILAKALGANGRPIAERSILERLAGEKPPFIPGVIELARLDQKKDPEAAIARLQSALPTAPKDPMLLRELSEHEREAGRPKEALAYIDTALAGDAAGAALLMERALVHIAANDLEAAEQDALKAFQAQPGAAATGALLLDVYARRGKLAEAAASFEQAEAIGALSVEARSLLARIDAQLGRDDKAIALLEKVVAERGDASEAKNDLAFLLAKQGRDLDRALALAQDARNALGASAAVADTLGYVYLKKELFSPAADQFREAIRLSGGDAASAQGYQYHLGMALRGQGRHAEAAAAFEAALAPGGGFPDAESARTELQAARDAAAKTSATP